MTASLEDACPYDASHGASIVNIRGIWAYHSPKTRESVLSTSRGRWPLSVLASGRFKAPDNLPSVSASQTAEHPKLHAPEGAR